MNVGGRAREWGALPSSHTHPSNPIRDFSEPGVCEPRLRVNFFLFQSVIRGKSVDESWYPPRTYFPN